MGKKAAKAPAPDPQIGQAAVMEAQISNDWLNFSKEQFAVASERQVGIDALTQRVTDQQLATQDRANQWAAEDRERYKTVFQPLEDEYLEKAKTWDSQGRLDKLADEAKADVMNASDQQRRTNNRQMAAMGVNPMSGRFAGQTRATNMQTALGSAGAQNNVRNQARMQAMDMRANAINMGKGLPGQALSSSGLGLSAGSSGVNTTLAGQGSWSANNSIMNQGFSGAQAGYANQANILNAQYGNQLNAWSQQNQASAANSAGMASGIGSIAGMAMMAF